MNTTSRLGLSATFSLLTALSMTHSASAGLADMIPKLGDAEAVPLDFERQELEHTLSRNGWVKGHEIRVSFAPLFEMAEQSNSYSLGNEPFNLGRVSPSFNLFPPFMRPSTTYARVATGIGSELSSLKDLDQSTGFEIEPDMSAMLLQYFDSRGATVLSPVTENTYWTPKWCHSKEARSSDSPPADCDPVSMAERASIGMRLARETGTPDDQLPDAIIGVRAAGKAWDQVHILVEEVKEGTFEVRARSFPDEGSLCEDIVLDVPSFWLSLTLMDLKSSQVVINVDERRPPAQATWVNTQLTLIAESENKRKLRQQICDDVVDSYHDIRRMLNVAMDQQSITTVQQMMADSGFDQMVQTAPKGPIASN